MSIKKIAITLFLGVASILFANSAKADSLENWTLIVNGMKNALGEGYVIESTPSVMTVTKDGHVVRYVYANNIIQFSSSSNDATQKGIENTVNGKLMDVILDYYGENANEFYAWLNSVDKNSLSIANNGIEYTATGFRVNIECGFKMTKTETIVIEESTTTTTTTVQNQVSNPTTGVCVSLGLFVIVAVALSVFAVASKKNYFEKI